MESSRELAQMDAEQLRDLSATLLTQLAERESQIRERDAELNREMRCSPLATKNSKPSN
jgi:hypothetical protein